MPPPYRLRSSHHAQHTKTGDGGEMLPVQSLVERQVADELAGLAVHGEEKALAVPLRAQQPHGHERIVDLAAVERDVLAFDRAGGVVAAGVLLHQLHGARFAAAVRAIGAVLHGNVILVGEEAGQIRRGKGLELLVVEGLDGVHVVVGHLARGVHRHALEPHRARAAHIIMVRDGHVFTGGGVAAHLGAVAADIDLRAAVVEPEGDVDALDLLDVVLIGERLR